MQQLVKEIFGKEGHKGVNPDEVVAVGAAIQGAQLLLGSKADVLLLDVTPLSLGIETLGGVLTMLIARNTTIPTTKKEVFSTAEDNQTAVTVARLPGRKPDRQQPVEPAAGPVQPGGHPAGAAGRAADRGHLRHRPQRHPARLAKDLGTGKEQKVRIEASSGLSAAEVERMRKEAEAHAEEDRRKRELIDARNQADQMVYQMEKLLKDNAGKLSEADRAPVQAAIAKVKEAMSRDDVQAIRRAIEDLQQASQAMAQHMQRPADGRRRRGGLGQRPRRPGRPGQGGRDRRGVRGQEVTCPCGWPTTQAPRREETMTILQERYSETRDHGADVVAQADSRRTRSWRFSSTTCVRPSGRSRMR